MSTSNKTDALTLGIFVFLGLSALGYLLGNAAIEFKQFDRSVTVKGLSEREYPADIVIWPIQFTAAGNDLESLYNSIELNTTKIVSFLGKKGINTDEITTSSPAITDKSAQQYGGNSRAEFRYSAFQTVTVYSKNIDAVRSVMSSLSQLGKQGIVITGGNYDSQTDYIFTRLNEVKPEMVEEATRKAREVAENFPLIHKVPWGKLNVRPKGNLVLVPGIKTTHISRRFGWFRQFSITYLINCLSD